MLNAVFGLRPVSPSSFGLSNECPNTVTPRSSVAIAAADVLRSLTPSSLVPLHTLTPNGISADASSEIAVRQSLDMVLSARRPATASAYRVTSVCMFVGPLGDQRALRTWRELGRGCCHAAAFFSRFS